MKRLFDLFCSIFGLILLLPIFIAIAIWITLDSKGGIFYKQTRVGKDNKDFKLIKFRTMRPDSDRLGQLTTGINDARITSAGGTLRRFKLDELPQLFNVLTGEMSLVGPRPEVRKYVELYTPEQQKVLSVKPGLTGYSALEFSNEGEVLSRQSDPEDFYINELMPKKLDMELRYVEESSFWGDVILVTKTCLKIFGKRGRRQE